MVSDFECPQCTKLSNLQKLESDMIKIETKEGKSVKWIKLKTIYDKIDRDEMVMRNKMSFVFFSITLMNIIIIFINFLLIFSPYMLLMTEFLFLIGATCKGSRSKSN